MSSTQSRPAGDRLELMTLIHVGVLVITAAWWFGGNYGPAQLALSSWASLAPLITLAAARRRRDFEFRRLRWLWPLGAFSVLVVASTFHLSFREIHDGAKSYFVELDNVSPWPSTARPSETWRSLWFFSAVYLACFNVFLVVRRRRPLRILLLVLAANAVVLAVFGTVQKLLGATELFFLPGKAVQPYFFSSFVYHNHWGAFTVLMTVISLGLAFHFWRRNAGRDVWHSPVPGLALAVMLLGLTVPLSGSRSCTVLMILLVAVAFAHWSITLLRRGRGRVSSTLQVAGGVAFAAGIVAFGFSLARPIIERRMANTYQQIEDARRNPGVDSRVQLYRDTWRMAREKLWFGWGMGSYPTVFYFRNSQRIRPDGLEIHFHDAHSDWLQSPAEVGLVGTALLGLCALVPLWRSRRGLTQSPLTVYLLVGCTVVLLYSALEFPFGNRAVICAWWTCFVVAIQYARLSRASAAEPSPLAASP